jgi:antitoxin component YwqK of YwqJK toxin-antitoxin module
MRLFEGEVVVTYVILFILLIVFWFFSKRTKTRVTYYEDGELDGLHTSWDKEGNVTATDTYKDGSLVE